MSHLRLSLFCAVLVAPLGAREFHVSSSGDNTHDGSAARPLQTISAAAALAQPGDTITVHAGVYRERVTPPRGGDSDARRIVYRAAPGETVTIKGSEVIRGWKPFLPGVWKATIPNAFFGSYHPYKDVIAGDWFTDKGRPHHTGEVYLNGKSLWETHLLERVLQPRPVTGARDLEGSTWTWFCETDETHTHLYANFHDRDPNAELVEINVRDSCFYPSKPGCDFITVRGFRMHHAATQWAAPTAEQIGLIGTHWSKGWIIEDNVISDSKCSGITLGKDRATGHNVWTRDPSKDGAVHYNEVVDRALAAGWSRAKIGSHLVRRNTISHCEQTGICGSLGAIFSVIEDNHIHEIWAKRQFAGAEMAGIKLHGAIDTRIARNRVHGAGRGLWLDWMTQGTRITGNVCYDNSTDDLFVEVNHGPFVVDHNLFLSDISLEDWSEGGAFAHNLFAGRVALRSVLNRTTPYHRAHDTAVAGRSPTQGGDHRFLNNVFLAPAGSDPAAASAKARSGRIAGHGLCAYDDLAHPLHAAGNVYLGGARPYRGEVSPSVSDRPATRPRISADSGHIALQFEFGPELSRASTAIVTTATLGKSRVSGLPFEDVDGSLLALRADLVGQPRSASRPTPGPFESPHGGTHVLGRR